MFFIAFAFVSLCTRLRIIIFTFSFQQQPENVWKIGNTKNIKNIKLNIKKNKEMLSKYFQFRCVPPQTVNGPSFKWHNFLFTHIYFIFLLFSPCACCLLSLSLLPLAALLFYALAFIFMLVFLFLVFCDIFASEWFASGERLAPALSLSLVISLSFFSDCLLPSLINFKCKTFYLPFWHLTVWRLLNLMSASAAILIRFLWHTLGRHRMGLPFRSFVLFVP